MNIDTSTLSTLWLENEKGDKWAPPNLEGWSSPPEGFIYQVSEFSRSLRREYSRMTLSEEVDACDHPSEMVMPTGGWIEGVHGRKCHKCNGTQTTQNFPEWPKAWSANGSTSIAVGNSSWSSSLVLAMTRPSLKEKFHTWFRGYFRNKIYSMDFAIKIAGNSCERCMNALAYQYGLPWGYKEFSPEWQVAPTSCDFCVDTSA